MLPKFSKPKNLSLPSGRIGPASARSFSRGVGCGALGSFFAGGLLDAGLAGPAPGLNLPKKEDIVAGEQRGAQMLLWRCRLLWARLEHCLSYGAEAANGSERWAKPQDERRADAQHGEREARTARGAGEYGALVVVKARLGRYGGDGLRAVLCANNTFQVGSRIIWGFRSAETWAGTDG